jgi:hypothetical protein
MYISEEYGLLVLGTSLSVLGIFFSFLFKMYQKIILTEKDVNFLRDDMTGFENTFIQHKSLTLQRHGELEQQVRDLGNDLRIELSNNAREQEEKLNKVRLELKQDINAVSSKLDEANKGIFEILKLVSRGGNSA